MSGLVPPPVLLAPQGADLLLAELPLRLLLRLHLHQAAASLRRRVAPPRFSAGLRQDAGLPRRLRQHSWLQLPVLLRSGKAHLPLRGVRQPLLPNLSLRAVLHLVV